MLTEICADIRNYFSLLNDRFTGDYSIVNGAITPPVPMVENQYYRIVGSIFNDGVHQKGETLIDEDTFHGSIWLMRVPQEIIDLDSEITAWQEKNGNLDSPAMSPFNSESFGGYSYSKSTNSDGSSGASWQDVFASRLNNYRKIRII